MVDCGCSLKGSRGVCDDEAWLPSVQDSCFSSCSCKLSTWSSSLFRTTGTAGRLLCNNAPNCSTFISGFCGMRSKVRGTSLQFSRAWGWHKLKDTLREDGVIFNAGDLLGHVWLHALQHQARLAVNPQIEALAINVERGSTGD